MKKKIRLLGTAFMAVLMCVNFVSCNSDELDNWTGSLRAEDYDVIVDGMAFKLCWENYSALELRGFDINKTSLDIPAKVNYKNREYPVVSVGMNASGILIDGKAGEWDFGRTNLQSIKCPESLDYIVGFKNCHKLTSVELPEKMSEIGMEAFFACTSLPKIRIGAKFISRCAFSLCRNLSSVTFTDNLERIGGCAFSECESLTSISFPKNTDIIGSQAFRNCNLSTIYCHSKRPPIIYDDTFMNTDNITVYVPSSYRSDYIKSDWGKYFNTNNIIGI